LPSTRRTFLQQVSAATLLSSVPSSVLAQHEMHGHPAPATSSATPLQPKQSMLSSASLTPFVDRLPLPARLHATHGKLRLAMRETHTQLHRDLPPTRIWSYTDPANPSPLTPVVEARSGEPLQIEWLNQLPNEHFLPIDYTLHGSGRDLPQVRTIAHLHGARVPSKDDGYPTDWFTTGHARTSTYPFQQEAATLWFHDHAMGINRLNTYAGLFGLTLLRDATEDALNLPSGPHEIPLVLYDRLLTTEGQLLYPRSPDPEKPWVPEFYGDALVVNGKIRPFVELEPRLYRLRILNASNSRFFQLGLSNGQPLLQIGSDQGLLGAPVALKSLFLAPAERADILLDLSDSAGKQLHLRTGIVDMLQIRVAPKSTSTASHTVPRTLRAITPMPESSSILTRTITLEEVVDPIQNPMLMVLNHKRWHEPVTERPRLNTTEIWEFVNLTEDTHPMHLHLVRFQVLDRRLFEPFDYLNFKKMRYLAEATPPETNERGWKDVVQCPPGMVTRIIVKFEGYTGNYLYHCHVLEHEANDMMRPFEVVA
jgi:spore coat protein A